MNLTWTKFSDKLPDNRPIYCFSTLLKKIFVFSELEVQAFSTHTINSFDLWAYVPMPEAPNISFQMNVCDPPTSNEINLWDLAQQCVSKAIDDHIEDLLQMIKDITKRLNELDIANCQVINRCVNRIDELEKKHESIYIGNVVYYYEGCNQIFPAIILMIPEKFESTCLLRIFGTKDRDIYVPYSKYLKPGHWSFR